jgi:hypothetical protein
MKKVLLVLCIVMMGSMFAFAAPTTYNAHDNTFCDIQRETVYDPDGTGPIGKVFVGGIDDETTNCGIANYALNGFKVGFAAHVPPNDIFVTSGPVLATAVAFGSSGATSYMLVLRVNNGCGLAAYSGDGTGNFLYAEDTCTLGSTPTSGVGKRPLTAARQ